MGTATRAIRDGRWLSVLAAAALIQYGCAAVPRSVVSPEVELTGLSLVDATDGVQRFRLSLRLHNPNAEPIPAETLRFSLRLAGGQGLIMGDTGEPLELAAGGTETMQIEVETELVSSVSSLLAVARGPDDAIGYELVGELAVGGRPPRALPIVGRGQVSLTATMGTR